MRRRPHKNDLPDGPVLREQEFRRAYGPPAPPAHVRDEPEAGRTEQVARWRPVSMNRVRKRRRTKAAPEPRARVRELSAYATEVAPDEAPANEAAKWDFVDGGKDRSRGAARIVGAKDLSSIGMRAHRSILQPDEYVDEVKFTRMVEQVLGFTMAEVNRAFPRDSRGGPPPARVRALRDRIAARFLEIEERGGNMAELGHRLGWTIQDGGNGRWCPRMKRAVDGARRARARRARARARQT